MPVRRLLFLFTIFFLGIILFSSSSSAVFNAANGTSDTFGDCATQNPSEAVQCLTSTTSERYVGGNVSNCVPSSDSRISPQIQGPTGSLWQCATNSFICPSSKPYTCNSRCMTAAENIAACGCPEGKVLNASNVCVPYKGSADPLILSSSADSVNKITLKGCNRQGYILKWDNGGQVGAPGRWICADSYNASSATQWTTSGTGIYYTGGNVGIGTNSPVTQLDVAGDIKASGNVYAGNYVQAGTSMGAYLISPSGAVQQGYRIGLGQNLYFDGINWVAKGDGAHNGASAILTNYGDGVMRFYAVPSTGGINKTIPNLPAYERMSINTDPSSSFNLTVKRGLRVDGILEVDASVVGGRNYIGGVTNFGGTTNFLDFTNFSKAAYFGGHSKFGKGLEITNGGYGLAPLIVDGNNSYNLGSYGYLNSGGNTGRSSGSIPISIKAEARVTASEFDAFSDARIKNVIDQRDPVMDLEVFNKLKFVDYRYIDEPQKGSGTKIGLIAQEIEKLLPQAVHSITDFVPDVFQMSKNVKFDAKAKTLTIQVEKLHGLKSGDLVRLVTPEDKLDLTVSKVLSDTAFVVDGATRSFDQVFVYGKEVKDYRVLDYDQVFSMGLSAMQALAKENEDLKARLEKLEARLKQIVISTEDEDREGAKRRNPFNPAKGGIQAIPPLRSG